MDKSDVEMADAEEVPRASGDNVEECKSKVLDSKVESNVETSPSEGAVEGDANESENGSKDSNKSDKSNDEANLNSEVDDQINPKSEAAEPHETTLNTEVEDQINPKNEATESASPLRSDVEKINEKSENTDQPNTESKVGDQTDAKSTMEKPNDAQNDLAEPSVTNGGIEEEKSTSNGVEGGNHVENVIEENVGAHNADKMTKSFGSEQGVSVGHGGSPVGEDNTTENADTGNDPEENTQLLTDISDDKSSQNKSAALDEILQGEDEEMQDAAKRSEDQTVKDELKEQEKDIASPVIDKKASIVDASKHETDDPSLPNQSGAVTPNSLVIYSSSNNGDHSVQPIKTVYTQATLPLMVEDDDGTPEEQAAFMKEIDIFYKERGMDFKPPKFYGQPLNCLKLWRAVIRLGGYDRVTGAKLWRQVGESFHPPKTCTTVSWTFRIFYEKSLLEYERHKRQTGDLALPLATVPEASNIENEGNGYPGAGSAPGRARRDAAARAMQGWHVQRILDNGEVGEPVIKEKNISNMAKREKNLKSIGSSKQKRPNEVENPIKAARLETYKQLVTSVVDVGPPADWVKINVRQTKDCFEVYALVPGLLREEVRVQSDPAGRLVITGQPEQIDNPWGITPFKKVVSLPARIDPLQTSAVVSLHGRLFVRVPFEQSNV